MSRIIHGAGLAAALICFAACSAVQEVDTPDPQPVAQVGKTIHFRSGRVDTKAAFGEAVDQNGTVTYPAFWTESDGAVMISLNYEYAVTAGVNASETDGQGRIERVTFDASFSDVDTQSPYRFYIVSPASALLWASAEREAVSIHVLANQTPTAMSVDEKAMVIVASSDPFQTLPDNVDVDFKHITSYGKMTLKNLPIPDGASLTSVTLICEQPLSGAWYYKFREGSAEEKEASSSIVLNTDNIDVAGGDPLWFACAPVGTELAGKALTIKANLDNGTALVRTITLNSTVNYTAGKVTKFSVNMASAETVNLTVESSAEEVVYQLVSSISDLSQGDEVIIANSTSPTYAMTAASSSSGLSAVAEGTGFTLGEDGYIRLPEGSSVLPLTVSSVSGSSIVFTDGGSQYLGYTSSGGFGSSSRYLSLSTTSRTWTISISNGSASVSYRQSSGFGGSSYYVRYNSNYFSLTTSSSTVALYKKVAVSTSASVNLSDDAVCGYSDYGAYLTGQNLVYNTTTDQLSREYGNDGTLTFSILAPAEDQVVEFAGIPAEVVIGDSFALHLTYISGITTVIDKEFTVYVVKEEGHRVWLSDGAGNGFIIKR